MALRDRQRPRGGTLVQPIAPGAAGDGSFNAEEKAILIGHFPVVIPGAPLRGDPE
jgi:hypothetical protein